MKTEALSVSGVARPPVIDAVSTGSASVRATARVRPFVPVELVESDGPFPASHPYIRRFWVAALGSGAIAELLRLVRAAEKGEEVRLPRYLPQLLRANLVSVTSNAIRVGNTFPAVPRELRWRFPPSLAGEHSRWILHPSISERPESSPE
jgi:hypothetical protein